MRYTILLFLAIGLQIAVWGQDPKPRANTVPRTQAQDRPNVGQAKRADGQVTTGKQAPARSEVLAQISENIHIIPQPVSLTPKEGAFQITPAVPIYLKGKSEGMKQVANLLSLRFRPLQGFMLQVSSLDTVKNKLENNFIQLEVDPNYNSNPEAYQLVVSPTSVMLKAASEKGLFYGLQTLYQLLPPDIFGDIKLMRPAVWRIPSVVIEDAPRYSYRGLHLDVGRHFFSVRDIKQYIDLMAMHKLNTLHWHLTEDQGWRIEIKKYPKLTEIGSKRKETIVGHANESKTYDGVPYGGFYTQDEVRDIVKYAAERFITVIPEIELPGHAQAALAAYPELGCEDKPIEVQTTWGVFEDVFCPEENTFKFLEDVLTEVVALFPSKYIHIGGDECPKEAWKKSKFCQDLMKQKGLKDEHELQSYFIQRIEKFLNSKGRSIIGWDEILEGGLAPNATVMSWRGIKGGIEAAKQGHDVIMTPTSHMYFDYYQANPAFEPQAIGGFLTVEKVYNYEPTPTELTPTEAKHVLGVQANLWTEYIKTFEHLTYMAYPRACAMAEVAWSPKATKNYAGFTKRLKYHMRRFDAMRIRYANHLATPKARLERKPSGSVQIIISSDDPDARYHYTLDGSEPMPASMQYTIPIIVSGDVNLRIAPFLKNKALGKPVNKKFTIHSLSGLTYSIKGKPAYDGNSPIALTDGNIGDIKNWDAWVGFGGGDLDMTYTNSEPGKPFTAEVGFFDNKNAWIHLPQYVTLSFSDDGINFTEADKFVLKPSTGTEAARITATLNSNGKTGKFVRIYAKNAGKIPSGMPGEGDNAWLFIDEVIVR